MYKKYSIISCTHRMDYFRENLVSSLADSADLVEIIAVENVANRYSIPEALNIGMKRAHGDVLIFCHHDIIFPPGWIQGVESQLERIERQDPEWGVCGVMGVGQNGRHVGSIEDPHSRRRMGVLPSVVQSLDEVCLMMRRFSDLSFDESLGGYHLYGADICLQARQKGRKCYAIDAPFKHLSAGNVDSGFYQVANGLKRKWSAISGAPPAIETTCGVFGLQEKIVTKIIVAGKIARRKICWKMGSLSDLKHI
jgi:hypothetical protein